jgi:xanthine dehydrogenase YagR molybdenum-binding subunit
MTTEDPILPVDPQDPAPRRRRNQDGARGGKPFKFGRAGDVREIAVNVPPDEPPPWQYGDTHAIVGQRTPRLDAVAKVTGKARYAYDMNLPGMVWAAFVRCPHARAKVVSVDYSEASKIPGVPPAKDYGSKEIRYAMQHFGVVAAETHAICLEAVRAAKARVRGAPHAARTSNRRSQPTRRACTPNVRTRPATTSAPTPSRPSTRPCKAATRSSRVSRRPKCRRTCASSRTA